MRSTFSEFPRVMVNYDEKKEPMYEAIVYECLRKLNESPTARALFKAIGEAEPKLRLKEWGKMNVAIVPPSKKQLNAPGIERGGVAPPVLTDQAKYDTWFYGQGGQLQPLLPAKVKAEPLSDTQASNGEGSICYLHFSTYEILSKSGMWLPPFITLGHELIHCLHALQGVIKADSKQEEWCTVGIKGYESEKITENNIRSEYPRMDLRHKYFPDD